MSDIIPEDPRAYPVIRRLEAALSKSETEYVKSVMASNGQMQLDAQTIHKLKQRITQLEADLAESNHWRERHSKDAEAYGKQSQSNWEKCKEQEQRITKLEQASVERERILREIAARMNAHGWSYAGPIKISQATLYAEDLTRLEQLLSTVPWTEGQGLEKG